MAKVKDGKKRNPIVWFLFAIVIPVMVAGIIAIVVLSFAGIDVAGWVKEKGNNIPVVSNFITTKEEKTLEDELAKANETIEFQKEEIEDLNREIQSLEDIVADLELDVTRLENRSNSEDSLSGSDATEVDEEVKKVAASFRKMDQEKAANIIQNLDQPTAVAVLANLSGEVRGGILAEMDPKKAADLTKEMMVR